MPAPTTLRGQIQDNHEKSRVQQSFVTRVAAFQPSIVKICIFLKLFKDGIP